MFLGSTRVLDQCDFINVFGKLSIPFFIPFSVFFGKILQNWENGSILGMGITSISGGKTCQIKIT